MCRFLSPLECNYSWTILCTCALPEYFHFLPHRVSASTLHTAVWRQISLCVFVHLTYFSTLAPSCFPITQAYLFYWVKRSKNTFWLLEKCWIYSITVRTHNLLAHFTQHQHTCENKCIILTCTVDTQVLKRLFLECYRYGSLSFFPKYYLNWVVVFRMALGYFFFLTLLLCVFQEFECWDKREMWGVRLNSGGVNSFALLVQRQTRGLHVMFRIPRFSSIFLPPSWLLIPAHRRTDCRGGR